MVVAARNVSQLEITTMNGHGVSIELVHFEQPQFIPDTIRNLGTRNTDPESSSGCRGGVVQDLKQVKDDGTVRDQKNVIGNQ